MTTAGTEPLPGFLGPLPDGAPLRRAPVAPPGAEAGPIAGWESLVIEASAPPAGLRVVQVTIDAGGMVISASDHVLARLDDGRLVQESVGGRLEPDGTFHGTYWRSEGMEPAGGDEIDWRMTPRAATVAEGDAIRAIVAEVLRRAGLHAP